MLLALSSFCLVSSITPGPNNMMLLSSGATFGLRRTVPHILGVSGGCGLMVLVVGLSLSGIAEHLPKFYSALHVAATAYLLWLAWRIATSAGPGHASAGGKPIGVIAAAAFQWVNPKAWAMVLGAVSSFARPERMIGDVLLIAGTLVIVGLPCVTLWAGCGTLLQRILDHPRALRAFNWSMAGLLVLSLVPGWQDLLANVREA